MCNAIAHPAQREVKIIERLYGNGEKEVSLGVRRSTGGLENFISI